MKKIILFNFLASLLILGGCYPDEVITNEETDIVMTHHDAEPDFSPYRTYAMPDALIVNPDEEDEIDPVFEAAILASIEQNMGSLGYTRIAVDDPVNVPDLLLLPERIIINHYAAGGCYYCWGWNPWYPGWGGYYPPYPPTYVVSYKSGTLIMSLIATNQNIPAGELPDAQWVGAINGLLRSSLTAQRVEQLIDQAFDQSPYLKVN